VDRIVRKNYNLTSIVESFDEIKHLETLNIINHITQMVTVAYVTPDPEKTG
jgi:hypothetical protein